RVEKPPVPSQAPDVLVALGRPDGYRGSYKQWEEANIAPQVVFAILSPRNTAREMMAKQAFYTQHGVLEFYVYDPEQREFWGLVRQDATEAFTQITPLNLPWISPLLGIRFELFEDGLEVFYPNGDRFEDPVETRDRLDRTQSERDQYRQERDRIQAKLQELGIDPIPESLLHQAT
ncbi:MAG: Uma2 family endonuclease, partial [Leptolyngbyaceae bacterium]|nr:Uma2 family endonuclease [Leptolyngbyaceae bacterium]